MQLNMSRTTNKENDRVARIKARTGEKILELLPEWKQRNLTSRSVELTRIQLDRALTAEEVSEVIAIEAAWSQIKALRATSDAAEASGIQPSDIVW